MGVNDMPQEAWDFFHVMLWGTMDELSEAEAADYSGVDGPVGFAVAEGLVLLRYGMWSHAEPVTSAPSCLLRWRGGRMLR